MMAHTACEAKTDATSWPAHRNPKLFVPPSFVPEQRNSRSHLFLDFVRAGSKFMNPYRFRFRGFRAKVRVHAEIRNFIVKTVDSADELDSILRLRYNVFYGEFVKKRKLIAMDIDQFDLACDHLMIVEKTTNACVGTYRLNCSLFSTRFYSETEFFMPWLGGLPGVKLEIGRACVHKSYRKGILLTLLWRGLGEYIKATRTKYIFGCSSVKTMEPLEVATVHAHLAANHAAPPNLRATPHEAYALKSLPLYASLAASIMPEAVRQHAERLIPTLLTSYLKAGAVICGEPALDKEFKCVDFLTLLDLERSADLSIRRFF